MNLRALRLSMCLALLLAASIGSRAGAVTITSLSDDFASPVIDGSKWTVTPQEFEAGTGVFTVDTTTNAGQLTISGSTVNPFWGGASLQSVNTFASNKVTLITVDRVSHAGTGSAHRTGIQLRQTDGTHILFAQNIGEGGWQINQNAGNIGANIASLDALDNDLGNHKMAFLIAGQGGNNATVVTMFDGVPVAQNNFIGDWQNNVDFNVRVTSLARAAGDTVTGVFDNFSAKVLPLQAPVFNGQTSQVAFPVSNTDLINGIIPTVVGNINSEEGVTTANPAALTNGTFGPDNLTDANQVVAIHNNTEITYQLNLANAPNGFDINAINTYSGWRDAGRDAQDYLVSVELLDAPGIFLPLSLVAFNPPNGNPANTAVFLTSPNGLPLAQGVTRVRFNFAGTENGYVGYREFDVIGVASATVPEPTVGLLGLLGLAVLGRRRRAAA